MVNDHQCQWEFVGTRGTGNSYCVCSIPVHRCVVCDDCDYGINEEAQAILKNCECLATEALWQLAEGL